MFALLWGTACDDFGDTNIDPNQPSTAPTSLLLTGAQTQISDVVGATTGVLYTQHTSETQYTSSSRYDVSQFDFNGWYTGPLADLEEIIRQNTDDATKASAAAGGSNANQIAVARILKAYFYHFMTDRWGALPYNEALQGQADFSPAYDDQETIYRALFVELNAAVAQMDGGSGVSGDILFGGDMARWAEFGNTLRMTMAMRISDIDPGTARSEFEDAVADGILTSDIMYFYLAETANQNPWYGRFITRYDYAASNTMVDYLKSVNDPRLAAFSAPAESLSTDPALRDANGDLTFAMFAGMPYGIAAGGDIVTSTVSALTPDHIYTQDTPLAIFTVAQAEFLLAEAAMRGWSVNGSAQSHYEAGIRASMSRWGVDGGSYTYSNGRLLANFIDGNSITLMDVDVYILQPGVAFDGTSMATAMPLIARQKWVALYQQGYEAWAEWRRIDLPVLIPAVDAVNNSGQIPVRHAYPGSESTLNQVNYDAAVAKQGPDITDTKLWWDVN